jgi:hypothetical protein
MTRRAQITIDVKFFSNFEGFNKNSLTLTLIKYLLFYFNLKKFLFLICMDNTHIIQNTQRYFYRNFRFFLDNARVMHNKFGNLHLTRKFVRM